jgi:hypothetical protein
MVRFSNSKLSSSQYIVRGITPIVGSATSVITPISTKYTVAHPIPPASRLTSTKVGCGINLTASDLLTSPGIPDPDVDTGLLYSNGYRYQYINFRADTDCFFVEPERTVTVQVQTDEGLIYIEETIAATTVVTAYVGNGLVVPQRPSPNVVTNSAPPPSKLPPLTNNNNC